MPKEEMAPNANPAVFEAMVAKGTPVFAASGAGTHISARPIGSVGVSNPRLLEREQMTAIESY